VTLSTDPLWREMLKAQSHTVIARPEGPWQSGGGGHPTRMEYPLTLVLSRKGRGDCRAAAQGELLKA